MTILTTLYKNTGLTHIRCRNRIVWFGDKFMDYAVVKTGGKQYRVQPGDTLDVEPDKVLKLGTGNI